MKLIDKAPFEDLLKIDNYYPSISIIMPTEVNINPSKELSIHLKSLIQKTSFEILKTYPDGIALPVIKKLKKTVNEIDYSKVTGSIALFVSPLFEKIYYLDLPVEERIVIDDSFEIRDLIYSNGNIHKYLLIILSSKQGSFYLGNTKSLIHIKKIKAVDIDALNQDLPEKIANFTDENKIKENLLNKFLQFNDKFLKELLQKYNLPVFIMGTSKTIGHFKQISHQKKQIAEYINGNYEEESEAALLHIIAPYVSTWNKTKKEDLLKTIDDALGERKLAIGIKEVWRSATQKKGRHLIVEKNYVFPARQGAKKEIIFDYEEVGNNKFYIKDAVDDAIEKVIASGGIIEFVEEGLLNDFQKIVLIQYYQ